MTRSTSEVAVCRSSDSLRSDVRWRNSRLSRTTSVSRLLAEEPELRATFGARFTVALRRRALIGLRLAVERRRTVSP